MTSGETSGSGSLPFDVTVAHQARVYNFVLGGKDNFEADRVTASARMEVYPELVNDMRGNHLLDVQRALGRAPAVPAGALRCTVQLLAELAPAVELIEAATGRSETSPLPVLR